MKASRIVLVFASFVMAGFVSEAAYADCPCVGTAAKECAARVESAPGAK